MTNWTIFDSQTTTVHGFALEWLPPQSSRYLTPHVIRGTSTVSIALEAGPYIGALPLSTGETLFIEPRVGRAALSRMLSVTARLDNAVRKEFEEFANLGYGEQDSVSWLHLLSRSFCNQLRLIEKNSLRPERVRIDERRQTIKGEIKVTPTLISLKRQETSPIHCTYRVKSYDTAEQRMLAAAAQTLLQRGSIEDDNRGILQRWAARFGEQRLSGDELSDVIRNLNGGRYTGPRAYYIPALVMAHLILVQSGLSFNALHSVQTEALLTNIYTLFESYLRITLRNICQ